MPSLFGKSSKQASLIENLDQEFLKIQKQHRIAIGDFPDIEKFRSNLRVHSLNDVCTIASLPFNSFFFKVFKAELKADFGHGRGAVG